MLKTIKDGMEYMELWPEEPLLNPVFAEYRVKKMMKLGRLILPPFMVLMVLWSYIRGGGLHPEISFMLAMQDNLIITILCLIFLLSMPLQGYYWFGLRSKTPLNPKLLEFYAKTCARLGRQQAAAPDMLELVRLIRAGLKTLGSDFLKEL
ncbi:MAG: DUF412 family protein [Succinivibrio sp.]|nr:DUF412 family protein [Succinivibrio sp.]